MTASIIVPVVLGIMGATVDYGRSVAARRSLQGIADSAALAGVGVFRTAVGTPAAAQSIARSQAEGAVVSVMNYTASVSSTNGNVQVDLSGDVPTTVMRLFTGASVHIVAHAHAQLSGVRVPTCLIALDPAADQTFSQKQASLAAPGCAVFSNSVSPQGMKLDAQAKLTADFICSSGGALANGNASFSATPITDCPARPDPLSDRVAPTVSACTATNLKIQTSTVLVPGVYCGGIELQKDASVLLQAGTYILKDGPLKANGNSSLTGNGVTFYLTGNNATLDVDGQSSLDLTAPAFGALSGILVFEDRNAKLGQMHKMHSRNAPNLLGTMYLSRGTLQVGAPGGYATSTSGMAESSAWTVIVVRQLSLNDKINLVLNTNYDATAVKPPTALLPAPTPVLTQ